MDKSYQTIILGGGASGMTAAITAAELGKKTLLLEKSDRLGRKISASGNGRCNLMNTGKLRYYGDPSFAEKVMANCNAEELIRFFRRYGLLVREEKEGRVYPVTMQSISVLNALNYALKINHADVMLRADIDEIAKWKGSFVCRTREGATFTAEKLIICTGGAAQKRLGGSFDGYQYMQSLGHHIVKIFPSLVPVTTDARSISGLSGIRVHCNVSLMDNETIIHQEKGEVLFTDYGLSGICIMQCSRHIRKKGLRIELDFLSSVFNNPDDAYSEISHRRRAFGMMSPLMLLEGILHPKLSYAVLKQAGIPLRGETAGSVTDQETASIVKSAYHYTAAVLEPRTLDDAQVTAGGVSCDEFDPLTMESRLVKGLFTAGEILNVDGDCGGFNLMFAFASGRIAGGFKGSGKADPEVTQ